MTAQLIAAAAAEGAAAACALHRMHFGERTWIYRHAWRLARVSTSHASHVTHHTSHVTRHTSHASRLTRHTSPGLCGATPSLSLTSNMAETSIVPDWIVIYLRVSSENQLNNSSLECQVLLFPPTPPPPPLTNLQIFQILHFLKAAAGSCTYLHTTMLDSLNSEGLE
jgi:hypothetical protein